LLGHSKNFKNSDIPKKPFCNFCFSFTNRRGKNKAKPNRQRSAHIQEPFTWRSRRHQTQPGDNARRVHSRLHDNRSAQQTHRRDQAAEQTTVQQPGQRFRVHAALLVRQHVDDHRRADKRRHRSEHEHKSAGCCQAHQRSAVGDCPGRGGGYADAGAEVLVRGADSLFDVLWPDGRSFQGALLI